jgi:hypothetical protein
MSNRTKANFDTAAIADLTAQAGDTLSIRIDILNDDDTPKDVRGWGFAMQVKTNEKSETSVLEFSTLNGKITAHNGYIEITETKENMEKVQAKEYVYDLEALDLSNNKKTIIKGIFEVTQDTTRGIL